MDELFAQLDFPEIMILGYVSPNAAVREAAQRCEAAMDKFGSGVSKTKGS